MTSRNCPDRYPSDLTDAEWKRVKPILDRFQFVEHDPREILNAIFYLLKGGVQWRMIPDGFPPWQTVYYHFRKWRKLNLFQRLCDRLRRAVRVSEGRRPSPSGAVVDTQSVSTTRQGGPGRGRDPNKQVKGRKRHVITDTLGLLLGVLVHPANQSDGQCLPHLLKRILGKVPRLKVIFADSAYEDVPDSLMWRCFHWVLNIVSREDSQSGFDPLPKRWVVERTFSWFGAYRRLSQDYEYHPETAEAMVRLGMTRLMLRRIA
jgi:putative transposase